MALREKVSDHKAKAAKLNYTWNHETFCRILVQPGSSQAPPQMSPEDWAICVQKEWIQLEAGLQSEIDSNSDNASYTWDLFNKTITLAVRAATIKAAAHATESEPVPAETRDPAMVQSQPSLWKNWGVSARKSGPDRSQVSFQ